MVGKKSVERLKQVVSYSKKIGCKRVVVHTGTSKNKDAYDLVAKRLENVNDPEVLICIENVPLWQTIPFSLTYDAETLIKLKNMTDVPLGIVLDIEHIYLLAYYIKKNPNKIIDDFFKKNIGLELVHVCGSDNTQYHLKEGHGLLAEHIPIGFDGKLKDKNIKDMIDHKFWVSKLKNKEIPIILEIHQRSDYDYMEELVKSKNYIDSILS